MNKKRERFNLLKFLGSGTFAQTHLAEVLDPKLRKEWGKEVVIKIPHDKEKEEILINELIMNASLHLNLQKARSKYIVQYLGYSKYDELFVMVMEYIEGKTLRNLVGSVGNQQPVEIEDALNIAEQVCEGLIEIHKFHIFHRDIKPENILISKKKRTAMIMDLGISKFLSSADLAYTTTGTIYYMPKELLEKAGGSFYSDVYSLGITMYEMVTGQLPFSGESIGEIIDNIRSKEPVPPIKVNPDIDKRLNKIILKAIDKKVNKRYTDAEDLLKAIKAFRQGIDEDDEYISKCISEAHELFRSDKLKEAENRLRKLKKQYSQNPKSYMGLGEFYNRCQRYQEAISIFKKGIEVDPDFALLHRDLALSLYQEGSEDDAVKALKKAVDLGLEASLEKHAINLLSLWEKK